MKTELRWCSVCGRYAADPAHESNPRFAAFHDGPTEWPTDGTLADQRELVNA